MRWIIYSLLFALLGIVHAISSSGNRLLVVNEEPAEKDKYSKFWADLEGERNNSWPCPELNTITNMAD